MKIIVLCNEKKINYPTALLSRFGFGSDENKINILLKRIYKTDKSIDFSIENTELDSTNFYDVIWNKTQGYYYILPATTAGYK